MRNRCGELDVAHAVAAHLGLDHLDPALFAGDAPVLHALVLAADALVIVDRTKDFPAEQTVPLGLEGAVVDGFGGFHLSEGPFTHIVRCGDPDAHGRVILRLISNFKQTSERHVWLLCEGECQF